MERDAEFMKHLYPLGEDDYVDRKWELYALDAQAVIAAMREPTEAMVDAMEGTGQLHSDDNHPLEPEVVWRAAIDAALK